VFTDRLTEWHKWFYNLSHAMGQIINARMLENWTDADIFRCCYWTLSNWNHSGWTIVVYVYIMNDCSWLHVCTCGQLYTQLLHYENTRTVCLYIIVSILSLVVCAICCYRFPFILLPRFFVLVSELFSRVFSYVRYGIPAHLPFVSKLYCTRCCTKVRRKYRHAVDVWLIICWR